MQYFKTILKITKLSLHKNISTQYKLYYELKHQTNTKKNTVYGVLALCSLSVINKGMHMVKKEN